MARGTFESVPRYQLSTASRTIFLHRWPSTLFDDWPCQVVGHDVIVVYSPMRIYSAPTLAREYFATLGAYLVS